MLNMLFVILSAVLFGALITYTLMNRLHKKEITRLETQFTKWDEIAFKTTFESAYASGKEEGRRQEWMRNIKTAENNQK